MTVTVSRVTYRHPHPCRSGRSSTTRAAPSGHRPGRAGGGRTGSSDEGWEKRGPLAGFRRQPASSRGQSGPVRGTAPFAAGRWSFADKPTTEPGLDHTAVQDAREVYWVSEDGTDTASGASARDEYYNGPDGKNGTFKVTYDGERFESGKWLKEDPPVYPPRS